MKITSKCSLAEIGALVCQTLQDNGVEAFLSGGAVVSIYTNNKYESFDLDFITYADRKKIKSIMVELGFSQDKSRLFIHPKSKYYVEFPGSAVLIGDEPISNFSIKRYKKNILRLLTPTDCIKDRLAAYIHWNDKQALDQALMVAKDQPYKLESIRKFCKNEGGEKAFVEFSSKLKKRKI